MKKMLLAALVVMFGTSFCHAIPQLLNFQGRISDSGNPANGQRDITFRIFGAATGGSALFAESHAGTDAVTVEHGVFNVLIGGLTMGGIPLAVFDGGDKYIEVQVGQDILPRQRMTSVGYAFRSAVADHATTLAGVAGSTPTVTTLIVNNFITTAAVVAGDLKVSVGADGVYTSATNNAITFTQPAGSPTPLIRTALAGQQATFTDSGSSPLSINAGTGGAVNLNPTSTGPVTIGIGGASVSGALAVASSVTASSFFGDGSHLTGISGGGASHGQQFFSTSGNFIIPPGVSTVALFASAGGGGGGGAGVGGMGGNGGGGGGGQTTVSVVAVAPGTIAVTIGAGGTPGAVGASPGASGGNGGAGGNTSFGPYLTLVGGGGGGGSSGSPFPAAANGASGGSGLSVFVPSVGGYGAGGGGGGEGNTSTGGTPGNPGFLLAIW